MTAAEIARTIDHTLLKPGATRGDIERMCAEALRGSRVRTCAVAGFPLGATLTSVKVFEANEAMRLGAQEIDMVISIGALKSGDDAEVEADIRAVTEASHSGGAICKAIIETGLLNEDEKIRACQAAMGAGADFVKTSTGFIHGGATVDDVRLIRSVVGTKMGVKASGGIRTLHEAQELIAAGATRIGTSSGVKIMEEAGALLLGTPPGKP
jgi:deoxyribose-phosphate aldolase